MVEIGCDQAAVVGDIMRATGEREAARDAEQCAHCFLYAQGLSNCACLVTWAAGDECLQGCSCCFTCDAAQGPRGVGLEALKLMGLGARLVARE